MALSPRMLLVLLGLSALALAHAAGRGANPGSDDVFKKGPTILDVKRHHNVVPRRELQTSCGLHSLTMTDRFMEPWDTNQPGTNLYELNITNNCAYDLIGETLFSNCQGFVNYEPSFMANPAGAGSCRPRGQQLLQRIAYTNPDNGQVYTNTICQLFFNQDCNRNPTVQLYPGQRLVMYYVDTGAHNIAAYQYTFANNPSVSYRDTNSLQQYMATYSVYTIPTGYSCRVGRQYPGLIYCPPI